MESELDADAMHGGHEPGKDELCESPFPWVRASWNSAFPAGRFMESTHGAGGLLLGREPWDRHLACLRSVGG